MSWLFKRSQKKDTTNESINEMQGTIALLEKREKLLQAKAEQELVKAKEALKKKNETSAKLALKRKKTYEIQIGRLQAQMANIQEMHLKLEEAAMDKMTLDAQKLGAKELKKVFKGTSIDKIEDDMDKVREAMDNANDISEALAQSFSMDLGDLDEEMANLMREDMEDQILSMKEVPKGKISAGAAEKKGVKTDEEIDDEFAKLEMDFA